MDLCAVNCKDECCSAAQAVTNAAVVKSTDMLALDKLQLNAVQVVISAAEEQTCCRLVGLTALVCFRASRCAAGPRCVSPTVLLGMPYRCGVRLACMYTACMRRHNMVLGWFVERTGLCTITCAQLAACVRLRSWLPYCMRQ